MLLIVLSLALGFNGCGSLVSHHAWTPLFPGPGSLEDWVVRDWSDLRKDPPAGAIWRVENGVLQGSDPRGTWLVSKAVYGDFELEFEFKLGPRGNSGCALRAPMFGDPAFDGMELQMADFRYNTNATPAELTGGLYRAVAPRQQVYRPIEWNHYWVRCRGARVEVKLNGARILDVDLDRQTQRVKRHDGTDAPPLRDRPRSGRIGFQELSRGGDRVEIRNAFIRRLSP